MLRQLRAARGSDRARRSGLKSLSLLRRPLPALSARGTDGVRLAHQLFARATRDFLDDLGPQFAAAISYYVLFAVFPLAILGVAIVGILLRDQPVHDDVLTLLLANIPLSDEGRSDLESLLTSVAASSGALGVLSVVGLLWSASAMMGAVRNSVSLA